MQKSHHIPKKCMGACRMKLTVSDRPLRHGLELLLLLVQNQRSRCYRVSPYTSPYGRVFSNTYLQLIIKRPVKSLLDSTLIRRPLNIGNQHIRIVEMMTMTWIKSESLSLCLPFDCSSAFRPPRDAPSVALFTADCGTAPVALTNERPIVL